MEKIQKMKRITLMMWLLVLLLLPLSVFSQDSWVRFEVQFDFYAPQESNFFMVSNGYGDTFKR